MRARTGAGCLARALALACLLLAGACSSEAILESRHVPATQTEPLAGVSYYLPKKLVTISVWHWQPPEGYAQAAGGPSAYFATYDGEVTVPDLRHQYLIVPRWDVAAHDTVQVTTTADGLLTSVRGKAEDKTADIVHELAKLASLLIKGPAPGPGTMRGLDAAVDRPRMVATYEFDPIDPNQRAGVGRALLDYGIRLAIEKQSDCPTAGSGSGCCTACTQTNPGIYYRLPIPYRLRLTPAGILRPPGTPGAPPEGDWERLDGGQEHTLLMPNEAVCLYVPVDRRRFVTSETSMEFEQGMLRSVTTDKPSELLGFVRIPVDVTTQILAIPSEMLTLRIESKAQEAQLAALESERTRSEASLAQAELDLLLAMKKYQQAKASKGGSDGE